MKMKHLLSALIVFFLWVAWLLFVPSVGAQDYVLNSPVQVCRTIDKVRVVSVTTPAYGETNGVTRVHVRYEQTTNVETNGIFVSGITTVDVNVPVTRTEITGVFGVPLNQFDTLPYGNITNVIKSIAELKVTQVLNGLQE